MTHRVIEHQPWSRTRWTAWVLVAFVLQLALVHALSLRKPALTRQPMPNTLHLPQPGQPALATLLELRDPTVLAWGSAQGIESFWMQPVPLPPWDGRWREEPAWLELDRSRLGQRFRDYVQFHLRPTHGLVYKPAPQVSAWDAPLPVLPLRTASTFRVEGPLAGRSLQTPPALRSWMADDVLTPTEVQVSVDGLGRVVAASLLPPGSGSEAADAYAVQQGRALRFAPRLESPREDLQLGLVVFDWHTLPLVRVPGALP